MNTPFPNNSSIESERIEREWLAQERALQQERLGADRTNEDARVLRYRLLVRRLREPLPDSLPEGFAQSLSLQISAARVSSATVFAQSNGVLEPFERGILGFLIAAFGLALGAVIALYAAPLLPSILAIARSGAANLFNNPWLLILVACLGLSAMLSAWSQRVIDAGR